MIYRILLVLITGLCFSLCLPLNTLAKSENSPIKTKNHPFSFLENKGQIMDQHGQPRHDIDFRISANGVNTFIGKGTIHYQWARPVNTGKPQMRHTHSAITDESQPWDMYRMDVTLVGADKNAQLIRGNQLDYYERYYLPQCGANGATAYGYEKLTYKNVYPNIDWVLYLKEGHMKYDFIVHPGGKVSDIRMQYGGATALKSEETGDITAITPFGSLTEKAPISFQGDGTAIASSFVLTEQTVSFAVDEYKGRLIIDPTLIWGTYYGALPSPIGDGISDVEYDKIDSNGVYACGMTQNMTNIATTGAHQVSFSGEADAFLVKFNRAGVRQWGTYFGGPGTDGQTASIACDTLGNIYMTAITYSASNIATPGSFQDTLSGFLARQPLRPRSDNFLVKFDATGSRLWATYYGGELGENWPDVATDGQNVYLASSTSSSSGIATPGSHQDVIGRLNVGDAYLVKFDGSGKRQWGTYYGGSRTDYAYSVTCDKFGFIYMTGQTGSDSVIATPGSHQEKIGSSDGDAFIVKFNSAGIRQWGTYYGGEKRDYGYSIICDDSSNIYLAGHTESTAGMATGSSQQNTLSGGNDIFLAKFDSKGLRRWATYYGGDKDENYVSICYGSGNVFIGASTFSTTGIATPGAYQSTNNATLATWGTGFLAGFNSNSGIRNWATYYGGADADAMDAIAYDPHGYIYIGGMTLSNSGITTPGSHNDSMIGFGMQSFLAKFCISPNFSAYDVAITGADSLCANSTANYAIPEIEDATAYIWTLPSGWTGSSDSNRINITSGVEGGLIGVQLVRCDDTSDLKTFEVYVVPMIQPLITVNGFLLGTVDTTYRSYQWFLNDTMITGATSRNYTVMANGNYKVVITNSFGCLDTSAVYTVTNYTGIESTNILSEQISIYPNPAENILFTSRLRQL